MRISQNELSNIKEILQNIYDRMGCIEISQEEYNCLMYELTGMKHVLYALGYHVDLDNLNRIEIEKAVTK